MLHDTEFRFYDFTDQYNLKQKKVLFFYNLNYSTICPLSDAVMATS